MTPLLVEPQRALCAGQLGPRAARQHDLVTTIETASQLGVALLRGLGVQREGVRQVGKAVRIVVLDLEAHEAAVALERDFDRRGLGIPRILDKFVDDPFRAAALEEFRETLAVDLQPVVSGVHWTYLT